MLPPVDLAVSWLNLHSSWWWNPADLAVLRSLSSCWLMIRVTVWSVSILTLTEILDQAETQPDQSVPQVTIVPSLNNGAHVDCCFQLEHLDLFIALWTIQFQIYMFRHWIISCPSFLASYNRSLLLLHLSQQVSFQWTSRHDNELCISSGTWTDSVLSCVPSSQLMSAHSMSLLLINISIQPSSLVNHLSSIWYIH